MDRVTCNMCGSVLACANVAKHMAMHRTHYGYPVPYVPNPFQYPTIEGNPNTIKRPPNQKPRKRQRDGKFKAGNAMALAQSQLVAKHHVGKGDGGGGIESGPLSIVESEEVVTSDVDDPRTQQNIEHTTDCSPYHRVCVWHHSMTECAGLGCHSLTEYIRERCTDSEFQQIYYGFSQIISLIPMFPFSLLSVYQSHHSAEGLRGART